MPYPVCASLSALLDSHFFQRKPRKLTSGVQITYAMFVMDGERFGREFAER